MDESEEPPKLTFGTFWILFMTLILFERGQDGTTNVFLFRFHLETCGSDTLLNLITDISRRISDFSQTECGELHHPPHLSLCFINLGQNGSETLDSTPTRKRSVGGERERKERKGLYTLFKASDFFLRSEWPVCAPFKRVLVTARFIRVGTGGEGREGEGVRGSGEREIRGDKMRGAEEKRWRTDRHSP